MLLKAKAQNMLKWFDVDFSGGVTLDEFMDGMEVAPVYTSLLIAGTIVITFQY